MILGKFTEMNQIKCSQLNALNMIWFMVHMKIQPEQQPQKKYYVINHLKLRDKSFKIK